MPQTPDIRFINILKTLVENGVEFILVGGVASALHGAPITTFDLDIVHRRTPENIIRLMQAMESIEAHYRHSPDRNLRPGPSHPASPGHQLLITKFGPLDVLETIGNNHGYEDLLGQAEPMNLGDGTQIMVISLPLLIQSKEEVGHPKDQSTLEILRETLRLKSKT